MNWFGLGDQPSGEPTHAIADVELIAAPAPEGN
jgi:hypothetical protein